MEPSAVAFINLRCGFLPLWMTSSCRVKNPTSGAEAFPHTECQRKVCAERILLHWWGVCVCGGAGREVGGRMGSGGRGRGGGDGQTVDLSRKAHAFFYLVRLFTYSSSSTGFHCWLMVRSCSRMPRILNYASPPHKLSDMWLERVDGRLVLSW